jgi:hypothetical protein
VVAVTEVIQSEHTQELSKQSINSGKDKYYVRV